MPGFNIPMEASSCGAGSSSGPSHTTETARKHRYELEVLEPLGQGSQGQGGDSLLLFLKKCTRPSIEIDEIVIHSGQDELFRPGKQHWKPIEFTFYEKLKGSKNGSLNDECAEKIWKWWANAMIDVKTSLHKPPSQYLKDTQLTMLDGDGSSVWKYYIYDCWPSKISPSDLSYTDTDIAEISVTLRYSKAWEVRK